MTALLSGRVWLAIAVAVLLAGTHWKAYKVGQSDIKAAWSTEKLEQDKQTVRLLENARLETDRLQAAANAQQKAKNVQIAQLDADLSDAIERLRNRPERPGGADMPADTGAEPVAGCTGAGLYRPDGEFLTRFAARAKLVTMDLAECQVALDQAREALNKN